MTVTNCDNLSALRILILITIIESVSKTIYASSIRNSIRRVCMNEGYMPIRANYICMYLHSIKFEDGLTLTYWNSFIVYLHLCACTTIFDLHTHIDKKDLDLGVVNYLKMHAMQFAS